MRTGILVLVAVWGTGCQGLPPWGTKLCPPLTCPTSCAEGPVMCPPTPAVPTPPQPCPPPQKLPSPERPLERAPGPPERAPGPPERAERIERVERQAQIAQEVMLVPRTVYVPYVAQTPVAPVRLAGVGTLQGSVTGVVERRETETLSVPPPERCEPERLPPERRPEGLAEDQEIRQLIKMLKDKIDRLEEAHRCLLQAPPPQQLPQGPALPCPTPSPCPPG